MTASEAHAGTTPEQKPQFVHMAIMTACRDDDEGDKPIVRQCPLDAAAPGIAEEQGCLDMLGARSGGPSHGGA